MDYIIIWLFGLGSLFYGMWIVGRKKNKKIKKLQDAIVVLANAIPNKTVIYPQSEGEMMGIGTTNSIPTWQANTENRVIPQPMSMETGWAYEIARHTQEKRDGIGGWNTWGLKKKKTIPKNSKEKKKFKYNYD